MAVRPFWKGYLKLSLVTCPVSMTPATTEAERVKFHTLNRRTGHRINSQYVDAETHRVVADEDAIKGYEIGDGTFVTLEDDEIDALALESTRTIEIETFVEADDVDWIWYDQPHYLLPDDAVAEEAYAVIRDAMAATHTAAISRLVLYRRERPVMLLPHDRGIILWTLRFGDEVRAQDDYFSPKTLSPRAKSAPDPELLPLVKKLIADRTRPWRPAMVSDPVQERLQDLIAAKQRKAGRRPSTKTPKKAPASNVINIADALRKSLAAETRRKGKGRDGPARL